MAAKFRSSETDRLAGALSWAGVAACGAVLFLLAACSSADGIATDAVSASAAVTGQDTVETEPTPEVTNDANSTIPEFEYSDDPPPDEEIVSTLCNLDQEYIRSLRAESPDGEPVVDDNLQLAVLSMSDNLALWDSLRPHYPEAGEAIDTARRIHDLWYEALLYTDEGDGESASRAMQEADREIANLPSVTSSDADDCVGQIGD